MYCCCMLATQVIISCEYGCACSKTGAAFTGAAGCFAFFGGGVFQGCGLGILERGTGAAIPCCSHH